MSSPRRLNARRPSPPDPQRRAALRQWLLALGLWLALVTAAAAALWQLRRVELDGQARELALLSLAMTDAVDRGLRGAEEGLQAMRFELADGRLADAAADGGRALRSRVELMPLAQTLWLLDRDGRLLAGSDATPPPALSSFLPGTDQLAAGVPTVSRPFRDLHVAQSLIALALRHEGAVDRPAGAAAAARPRGADRRPPDRRPPAEPHKADGAPANRPPGADRRGAGGWVVVAIPAGQLLGAFNAALQAADARMAIVRSDGVRLVSSRVGPPLLDEATLARRLANRPPMEVRRLSDGSDDLIGLHEVPRYGIKVVLTRHVGAVLTAWRETAQVTAGAALLLAAVLAAALAQVQRADRRRSDAQQALAAQRARAGRLASLGTLAGGVAHDFNNLLAGIVGYGEMAQETLAAGRDPSRQLARVLQAAQRGQALVARILAFTRGSGRLSTPFALQPVVDEALDLLAASLPAHVELRRALDAAGAGLRGDPTQVFEAVMNLATNAVQAMPAGGLLLVRLQRLAVAAPRVLSHSALPAGRYLVLSVADQGAGIAPEVMERLFEPFFTTRAAQAGTGLGLAVVHGVVAELGGAIDVRSGAPAAAGSWPARLLRWARRAAASAPGAVGRRPAAADGACFTLYLPECEPPAEAPAAAAAAPAASTPSSDDHRHDHHDHHDHHGRRGDDGADRATAAAARRIGDADGRAASRASRHDGSTVDPHAARRLPRRPNRPVT